MDIRTGTFARCPGGAHYSLDVIVNGTSVVLEFDRRELSLKEIEPEERRDLVLRRLRSAILEVGASTLPEVRAAIENKDFKV